MAFTVALSALLAGLAWLLTGGSAAAQQTALCEHFPDWVMEAAKDVATK